MLWFNSHLPLYVKRMLETFQAKICHVRDLENGIKKQETEKQEHIKHRVGKKNSYSTGHVSNLPV